MSKTILVTGGTGFLGSYIIKALVEKNYRVKALRRSTAKLPFYISAHIFSKVEWVEGDILDVVSLEEAMEHVDTVIHSAAVVSFHKSERKNMYQVNVDGTANVVNMALEQNIKKVVYISSVAALGRTANGESVTEEKKWEESSINTHYAISKHKAEMEVWRAISEGLPAVIVNPSTVIGFGDWNNSSTAIFKNVYNEFPWYTVGVNGFVYVEDIAKAVLALVESNIINERFILNGDNWTFQQLLNTIADGLKKKKPYRLATPAMGSIAWRLEKLKSLFSGKKPLLSRETARIAQSKTYFQNAKFLSRFPDFAFTPLDEAIQISCKQYLNTPAPVK